MMLHFENDYNEGMHPLILEALVASNNDNLAGYGMDTYAKSAKERIRRACGLDEASIFFLTGGTQANQVVIKSLLASYEGVIATETGHISTHEAGAIESTGHKVLTLPHHLGKLAATDLQTYLRDFYADANHEHMVFPGMVYLSHPTEYGTLYSKAELEAIATICRRYHLPLFLDGARLGYGLAAIDSDLDLPTIAELCDIFYIGGTKMGAIAGEAVVFTGDRLPKHFSTIVKQSGALLAKGRLLSLAFDCFFQNNLYVTIGQEALRHADRLKAILKENGYRFYLESPTNQQFIIIENKKLAILAEQVVYSFWEKYDDNHTVIRLATSWSTTDEDMTALEAVLEKL